MPERSRFAREIRGSDEGGRRVLVVDDNADAREALRILLDDEGFEVRTAADTPDALAQAEIFCPDVVLLDIGVPGDRRLRGRAEAPDVTGRFDPRA